MRLQPNESDSTSYDLSFTDDSDQYSYQGVRTIGDGQYVLIFDPIKKHFVLHRIDSTFDMNLVGAPWSESTSQLRKDYPQLQPETKPISSAPQRRTSKSTKNSTAAKADPKRRKQEKPKKPKPPVREPTPVEDNSDDGLTVEYPDGAPAEKYQYQSTPIFSRNDASSDEDEDAEHESLEEEERNQDVDHLRLPSPANNVGGMSDEEIELDLEAELEQAMKETEENGGNESSESEEE